MQLSCELGLAALIAKLTDHHLDGACLPAHLHVLLSLGAGVARVPMEAVGMCSYQDLAVVLAQKNPEKPAGTGAEANTLRLGMLTPGSPARLLTQRWLQLDFSASRVEPVNVPLAASQLVDFLSEGAIDGFCGIEPGPTLALARGGGEIVARSADLFPWHPGGALALQRELAQNHPPLATALTRALSRARQYCADPVNAHEVWNLVLAQHRALSGAGLLQPAEAHRAEPFFAGPAGGSLLDDEGAAFVALACQAAAADALRGLDLKAEIARVFRLAGSARGRGVSAA